MIVKVFLPYFQTYVSKLYLSLGLATKAKQAYEVVEIIPWPKVLLLFIWAIHTQKCYLFSL